MLKKSKKMFIEFAKIFLFIINEILQLIFVAILYVYFPKSTKPSKKIQYKPLVIAVNGPSFRLDKISYFKEEADFLFVNDFAIKERELFFQYKPRFYGLLDPTYYDINHKDYKKIYEVLHLINWDMTIICFSYQNMEIHNSNIDFYKITPIKYKGKFNLLTYFFASKNIAAYGFSGVLEGSIFAALINNYKKIYLIGADNNIFLEFNVDIDNNVYRDYKHFYGSEKIIVTGSQIPKGHLYEYFFGIYSNFKNLYDLSILAKKLNAQIINTTPDSFIDVFEKVEIV